MTDMNLRGSRIASGTRLVVAARGLSAVAAAFMLAACASTMPSDGATPGGGASGTASGAIRAGQARLKLTRVSSILYAGAPATVKVNGNEVASVSAGSTSEVDIAPGASKVTVEAWSYPGTWTVNINAKAGQTYVLEIKPREASFGPSMLGPIGGAMDAGANKNAGAFEMRLVGH
jgi:hypothetical protein